MPNFRYQQNISVKIQYGYELRQKQNISFVCVELYVILLIFSWLNNMCVRVRMLVCAFVSVFVSVCL